MWYFLEMRQIVDVLGGMCSRVREKEGRREGEGVGQREEREGSRSVQSRKMGWEKEVGKCLVPRPSLTCVISMYNQEKQSEGNHFLRAELRRVPCIPAFSSAQLYCALIKRQSFYQLLCAKAKCYSILAYRKTQL